MLKDKVSGFLIVMGLVLMLYGGYVLMEWRWVQTSNPVLVEEPVLTQVEIKEEKPAYGVIHDLEENMAKLEIEEEPEYVFETTREAYQDGMMTISIPKIEVLAEVMAGTSKSELKRGPGLYDISPLAYEADGNVLIAGHRTTYGKWFRHVDKLEAGDPIVLDFENHEFMYEVERVFIVAHNDWSVTEPQGYSALTLTACHPLYSAKQRIVVRAKLIEIREY